MNEKQKNWLKNIGIAGFIFFLLKGIFWLLFGTAFYKWIKELLLLTSLSLSPIVLEAQIAALKRMQDQPPYSILWQFNSPKLCLETSNTKPFFCRIEDQLNAKRKTYFKFRLGSLDYSNHLEYSRYLQLKEREDLFLK